ncbi:MAG: hypothetical protein ACRCTE_10415 [Cellulosilyticaceae bacterium]
MNNNLNKMFGEKYMKMCAWVPWVAMICLIISLNNNQWIKWGFTYGAFVLLLTNAFYIVYKFLRYQIDTKKCR